MASEFFWPLTMSEAFPFPLLQFFHSFFGNEGKWFLLLAIDVEGWLGEGNPGTLIRSHPPFTPIFILIFQLPISVDFSRLGHYLYFFCYLGQNLAGFPAE